MATKLLIVESPGKIKKLSQILGSDWLVKASFGRAHLTVGGLQAGLARIEEVTKKGAPSKVHLKQ